MGNTVRYVKVQVQEVGQEERTAEGQRVPQGRKRGVGGKPNLLQV